MPVIETRIDPRSDEFQANAAQLRALVDDLDAQTGRTALGGGDKARAKHTERGKLLVMAGATIGSVTRRKVPKALSPRSAEASSRLRSKPSKPEVSTVIE